MYQSTFSNLLIFHTSRFQIQGYEHEAHSLRTHTHTHKHTHMQVAGEIFVKNIYIFREAPVLKSIGEWN
jgi:hypothetical protein